MKRVLPLIICAIFLALTDARGGSTINNTNAFAYGANIGWLNWHGSGVGQPPGTYGVNIDEYIVQGWIYGANVGWISMCRKDGSNPPNDLLPANNIQYSNTGSDYGINYTLDPSTPGVAYLRGFAYGANIGWINFDSPTHPFPGSVSAGNKPQISLFTGKLHGYAWSETCGWISLDEFDAGAVERYVQTDHVLMGVDSDSDGIADAFEYQYFGNLTTANASSDKDGDGIIDKDEYLDGTSPLVATDKLRITAFATTAGSTTATLTWTTNTARLYYIETSPDLVSGFVTDTTFASPFAPDVGATTTRIPTRVASETKRFYRARSYRPLP
jgi:hypothetical protein